jgi:hypothetical protein
MSRRHPLLCALPWDVTRCHLPIFRFALFERGITMFLEYRRFESALTLYRQMFAERLYASSGLRARMFVCSSIIDAPNKPQENLQSLFNKLSGVLSLPTYSQRSLRELLDVMKNSPIVDSQFVSKLVDQHTGSRGSIYELELRTLNKLVSFYAHAGSLDAAESLVVSPSSRPRPPVLYTTLMSSLAECSLMRRNRCVALPSPFHLPWHASRGPHNCNRRRSRAMWVQTRHHMPRWHVAFGARQ